MQMILLSGTGRWRVNLSSGSVRLGATVLAVVVAALVYAGFHQGIGDAPLARSDDDFERDIVLLLQQREINEALAQARRELSRLSHRAGTLETRLVRVESLGQQVAGLADLDVREFRRAQPRPADTPPSVRAEPDVSAPGVLDSIVQLSARLDVLTPQLDTLEAALIVRRVEKRTEPKGRPVRNGWISSSFGHRTDPLTSRRAFHAGMDVAGRYKTPIIAVASGVVTESGVRRGYGNLIEIRHRRGLSTRYAHNAKNLVAVGDAVKRGDVVALMGSTGRSTGAHVHFEVLKAGQAVNPRSYVRSKE
jgi:murein DD-endopeptidase MepM/ murein hydrolase activator NlpD